MDRQTLDMEGARQGEISAASLQMGDDTIAIQRIATMSVAANDFAPWDTPKNRATQKAYATFFVSLMFLAIMGLGWWALMPGPMFSLVMLFIGGFSLLSGLACGIRAAGIASKLRRRENYYRLIIGTSDARQIPLVDDNREVLCKIRDIVRHKMDTDDRDITGRFDLNLDLVDVSGPGQPAPEARPKAEPAPRASGYEEADELPMPKLARRRDDDHQDALFDKVADALKPVS